MADALFCGVAKLLFEDAVVGFALATDGGALPSPGNKCNILSPDIVERDYPSGTSGSTNSIVYLLLLYCTQ
eukprot:scaffold4795_cov140-Skeletonema_menzelii.AAC.5